MPTFSLTDLLNLIIVVMFLLGTVSFAAGITVLLTRAFGSDMRAVTKQSKQLIQKGLVDDLSGLVGNASAMLTASSQLVRTTAGIGLMLIIFGLLQIAASIGLILLLQGKFL